ncbi:hypothetical protein BC834DRAFT_975587 [Gloeopeniophorella convolvens]|nr:hypothetical protein BC834DRAFT_975587 [Gloeopeniophorella convolvens]
MESSKTSQHPLEALPPIAIALEPALNQEFPLEELSNSHPRGLEGDWYIEGYYPQDVSSYLEPGVEGQSHWWNDLSYKEPPGELSNLGAVPAPSIKGKEKATALPPSVQEKIWLKISIPPELRRHHSGDQAVEMDVDDEPPDPKGKGKGKVKTTKKPRVPIPSNASEDSWQESNKGESHFVLSPPKMAGSGWTFDRKLIPEAVEELARQLGYNQDEILERMQKKKTCKKDWGNACLPCQRARTLCSFIPRNKDGATSHKKYKVPLIKAWLVHVWLYASNYLPAESHHDGSQPGGSGSSKAQVPAAASAPLLSPILPPIATPPPLPPFPQLSQLSPRHPPTASSLLAHPVTLTSCAFNRRYVYRNLISLLHRTPLNQSILFDKPARSIRTTRSIAIGAIVHPVPYVVTHIVNLT